MNQPEKAWVFSHAGEVEELWPWLITAQAASAEVSTVHTACRCKTLKHLLRSNICVSCLLVELIIFLNISNFLQCSAHSVLDWSHPPVERAWVRGVSTTNQWQVNNKEHKGSTCKNLRLILSSANCAWVIFFFYRKNMNHDTRFTNVHNGN